MDVNGATKSWNGYWLEDLSLLLKGGLCPIMSFSLDVHSHVH